MSYQYLLEKTLRNKTILPKFDRDKIELNFGGCKMQYVPKEFNPYERNYQTRLILKSANDDIQYGDYLIDDFWEVVKLVDKKYYDKHFEYYAIDRAKNIIDYYTQDSDFLYSYQNDGTKFIEISDIGVLTLKNDVVKFTFTDNNISINIKDYSFDSLYNSIELSKQRGKTIIESSILSIFSIQSLNLLYIYFLFIFPKNTDFCILINPSLFKKSLNSFLIFPTEIS